MGSPTKLDVLVCCEGGRQGCAAEGSDELLDACRAWLREQRLERRVSLRPAGCLGHCKGVACEIRPADGFEAETRRALRQSPEDFEKLKRRILKSLGFDKATRRARLADRPSGLETEL